MTVWLDNHLSPALARWIQATFNQPCAQVRELGLARANDHDIFLAARAAGVSAFITKDRDFAELVGRLSSPPAIILLTFGNTSTAYVCGVLKDQLITALELIASGEPLVEIGGAL